MAEQARSIEYRLKRYRGSLRSPMRENRTTVGQLPVFSLHFCSIVSLTVSLFSPLLFFFLSFSLSVFQRGLGQLLSVYQHCWHDKSAEITRISFPSSGRTIAGEPCNQLSISDCQVPKSVAGIVRRHQQRIILRVFLMNAWLDNVRNFRIGTVPLVPYAAIFRLSVNRPSRCISLLRTAAIVFIFLQLLDRD